MLTAIPVRWLEEDRVWRVKTNLTHPRPLPGGEQPFGWVRRVRRDLFSGVLKATPKVLPSSGSAAALASESTLRESTEARMKKRAWKEFRNCAGGGLAISDFGFRISDFRLRRGWTLIESIAVLSVIAILVAVMVPPIIKRVDRAAWTKETADLNAIGDAFTQSILRNKTIPSHTTWASAVASQMALPVSAISTNSRRYARAFYIDQNLDINGAGLPYTQTTNGSGATKPATARVMIVSSLATALPTSFASGVLSTSDFDPIWNAPEGATPSTWTTWAGSGEDLRIKKINLEPLFHQLILFNHDPTNAPPAPFSIDRGATNTVSSGQCTNRYYLASSDLWLLDSNFNVRTRYLLSRSISFIFESGSWRGQIQGGETFSDSNGAAASDFLKLATTFYGTTNNPSAQSGASPSAVLVSMYTFMFDYVFWATECPHFGWHGLPTNTNPSNLPEWNMLNDIGSSTSVGSIGKYSGTGGLLK